MELYAGKPSPFWLSPAHEGGSLRVDPYRWAHDAGRPEDHFEHYWEKLFLLPTSKSRKRLGHWARAASQTCLTLLDKLYGVAVRE